MFTCTHDHRFTSLPQRRPHPHRLCLALRLAYLPVDFRAEIVHRHRDVRDLLTELPHLRIASLLLLHHDDSEPLHRRDGRCELFLDLRVFAESARRRRSGDSCYPFLDTMADCI